MRGIIITILLLLSLVFQAKTIKIEIAFSDWDNPSVEVANDIVDNLNSIYSVVGIDFVLFRATDGANVKHTADIDMLWAMNQRINNAGADVTLILTQSHTGNTLGFATVGGLSTKYAVAVYDYNAPNALSGIAHELGHIFGLVHVGGDYIMNEIVDDYCVTFHPDNIKYLKSL